MRRFLNLACLRLIFIAHSVSLLVAAGYENGNKSNLHQWAIEVKGGRPVAQQLATDLGLMLKGQIGSLNVFVFEGLPPSLNDSKKDSRLSKRGLLRETYNWDVRIARKLSVHPKVTFFEKQVPKKRVKRSLLEFRDPLFEKSWFLLGEGSLGMNIEGAWKKGYTGKNVVVSILDDGLEKDHPDIAMNYDPEASWDINENDNDPSPRYDSDNTNRHGTRCAGEVVAVANNSVCSVGVAYNARIGGVRMLDGQITDVVEATALSWNPQHIDIYSASWGPNDDGQSLEGPGVLGMKALMKGVNAGRKGRGNIFVWASGNGGGQKDSCACDGYASSIYTISLSSTTEWGTKPWYLEECASTIATTFSSGNSALDRQIVTTDIHHTCTEKHTGTSASAALAAGIIASVLEANPRLTWRDVQHLIVETSKSEPLKDGQWITNGIGRLVSSRYGFGLLDGVALVDLAESWHLVGKQHVCKSKVDRATYLIKGQLLQTINFSYCQNASKPVRYLEHVQAQITVDLSTRGNLGIYLTSPSGTTSELLPFRSFDDKPGKFTKWFFTSVQFWGESANGQWRLKLVDSGNGTPGNLTEWIIFLYGTEFRPKSAKFQSLRKTTIATTLPPTTDSTATDSSTILLVQESSDLKFFGPPTGSDVFMALILAGFAFAAAVSFAAICFQRRRRSQHNDQRSTIEAQNVATISSSLPMTAFDNNNNNGSSMANC